MNKLNNDVFALYTNEYVSTRLRVVVLSNLSNTLLWLYG